MSKRSSKNGLLFEIASRIADLPASFFPDKHRHIRLYLEALFGFDTLILVDRNAFEGDHLCGKLRELVFCAARKYVLIIIFHRPFVNTISVPLC